MDARALLLTLITLLSACGGGSSDAPEPNQGEPAVASDTALAEAPIVDYLLTSITNRDAFISGERIPENDYTSIMFNVTVKVTNPSSERSEEDATRDPYGIDTLDYIYFTTTDEDNRHYGKRFYLLEPLDSAERLSCRSGSSARFECKYSNDYFVHDIDITNWELHIADTDGYETTQDFELLLPGGLAPGTYDRVITDAYEGDKFDTTPALQSLKVKENKIQAYSDAGRQAYSISFSATDFRIKDYKIEFFAFDANPPGGSWIFAGIAAPDSPSIVSAPVVIGRTTTLFIPWSEIELFPGFDHQDVRGIHVVALDEPQQVSEDMLWYNSVGVSEFTYVR